MFLIDVSIVIVFLMFSLIVEDYYFKQRRITKGFYIIFIVEIIISFIALTYYAVKFEPLFGIAIPFVFLSIAITPVYELLTFFHNKKINKLLFHFIVIIFEFVYLIIINLIKQEVCQILFY